MGGYRINFTIINNVGEPLEVIEKSVWHNDGGEWSEDNGKPVLWIEYNGSGLIRFQEPNGQRFSAVVGYTTYSQRPWADVQVNLERADTGTKLLPEYCGGGRLSHESHTDITRTTAENRTVRLNIGQEGSEIEAYIEYS